VDKGWFHFRFGGGGERGRGNKSEQQQGGGGPKKLWTQRCKRAMAHMGHCCKGGTLRGITLWQKCCSKKGKRGGEQRADDMRKKATNGRGQIILKSGQTMGGGKIFKNNKGGGTQSWVKVGVGAQGGNQA